MDPVVTILGERLRKAREERGWSIRKLEAKSGVSNSAINLIESGRRPNPRLSTVQRLAAALDVSVAYLSGQTDDPRPPVAGRVLTAEERLKEDGLDVWLRGEGLTDEDVDLIKAMMERLRKKGRRQGNQPD